MGASLLLAGLNAEQGLPYFAGAAAATGSMAWWVYSTDLGSSDSCWDCFVKMKWCGLMVFAGALGDVVIQPVL